MENDMKIMQHPFIQMHETRGKYIFLNLLYITLNVKVYTNILNIQI